MGNKGKFGEFGGQYAPETLMQTLADLEREFQAAMADPAFLEEFSRYLREYGGRPSMLYYAEKMTKDLGGARIYLKREDLNHTGSHKINNVIGQGLLARRMGKTKLIAETGAGQHGVAAATIATLFDMSCQVFMGREDMARQELNVFRMNMLGAKVTAVTTGTSTLKDATNEAIRTWASRADDTFYLIGSAIGPHPYPTMVREFQAVISKEIRRQLMEREGRLPDMVMACVGGGSNAIGAFADFINDPAVELVGCEAAGHGVNTQLTAAAITKGRTGVLHGNKSLYLQDDQGGIMPVYSISAGLDYPGVGPQHAYLATTGRAKYYPVSDAQAVEAFRYLTRVEGILPAIESSHAVAKAMELAPAMDKDKIIVICLSGRGDKDVYSVAKYMGVEISEQN